jgi:hypothetical protein
VATVVAAAMPMMAITTTTATIMHTRFPGAPTRRVGRWRGCGSKCCLRGDLGLICKHGLLEGEHGASLAKGGERDDVSYVVGCGGELGVQATDEVEDELGLEDGVADVAKRVDEGFDVVIVIGN